MTEDSAPVCHAAGDDGGVRVLPPRAVEDTLESGDHAGRSSGLNLATLGTRLLIPLFGG